MKNLRYRIGCLFMAFTVLFSSTGYGIFEHTCNFTQKKTISLDHEDECCTPSDFSDENTFRKTGCCSITKTLTKVSVNQAGFEMLSLGFVINQILYQHFDFTYLLLLTDESLLSVNLANAPPIPTKLFLALIQTYLI